MNVRYTSPSGPTARSANEAPDDTGVTRMGAEKVRPWSVERENSTAFFGANPLYCDQATYTLPASAPLVRWSATRLILSWNSPVRNCPEGVPFFTRTVRSYVAP